jgi:hypothetical protein
MIDRSTRGNILVDDLTLFIVVLIIGLIAVAGGFLNIFQMAPHENQAPIVTPASQPLVARVVKDNFDAPATILLPATVTPGMAIKFVVQVDRGASGYLTLTDAVGRGLAIAITDRGHDAISLNLEPGQSVVTGALTGQPSAPGLVIRVANANGYDSVIGLPNIHTQLGDLVALQGWGTGYSVLSVQVVTAPTE